MYSLFYSGSDQLRVCELQLLQPQKGAEGRSEQKASGQVRRQLHRLTRLESAKFIHSMPWVGIQTREQPTATGQKD